MPVVVAVAIGGALGAAARYGISSAVTHATNLGGSGTFVVNIAGAFLLGVLLGATEERLQWSQTLRTALAIGVLGGFTTFSTYMWDTVEQAEGGDWLVAGTLLLATVALGLVAMVGGLAVGRS
jgi:CrcB protein